MAMPEAPAPAKTTRTSLIFFFTTLRAFSRAASTTTAVPCWSSWKTGMSSSFCSRSSISKQRGAAMSSRLMPPNPGAIARTILTISSASLVSRQRGNASTSAKALKRRALPSITGIAALRTDVAQPEHRRAVRDDGDRVLLDRQGVRLLGIVVDRHADAGDAGRVGHREVVARLHRHLAADLDLAAEVHEEGPVGDVEDARRRGSCQGPRRSPGRDDRRRALKVMSRVRTLPPGWIRSMAPMSPPARLMAEVTFPSIPGRFRISTRTVRL